MPISSRQELVVRANLILLLGSWETQRTLPCIVRNKPSDVDMLLKGSMVFGVDTVYHCYVIVLADCRQTAVCECVYVDVCVCSTTLRSARPRRMRSRSSLVKARTPPSTKDAVCESLTHNGSLHFLDQSFA